MTHTDQSARRSPHERREVGRQARETTPRGDHADWAADPARPNPVDIIEQQNESRVPWLVPIRRQRMSASPFAFFRGTTAVMASDLSRTPTSGITVQACGDAHLSNFGFYASPERNLIFDVNDFDETLQGPWEWDVKRLATSVTVAAQDLSLPEAASQRATKAAVIGYQEAMAQFAERGALENWYTHLAVSELAPLMRKKKRKKMAQVSAKAKGRTSQQALKKLAEKVDGELRIKSQPPLLIPLRDLAQYEDPERLKQLASASLEDYQDSLPDDRKYLLSQYRLADLAVKNVGVGSVGTRSMIALLVGRDNSDPLFLQFKEAGDSVLANYLPASEYAEAGRRVVEGQRLTQAVSDIFLGWSRIDDSGRSHYWRQLRDWKGSIDLKKMGPMELGNYARVCGWTLAHGHARSGDPIAISAYLGSGPSFARAISSFAAQYARQNQTDYELFKQAIDDGQLVAASHELA